MVKLKAEKVDSNKVDGARHVRKHADRPLATSGSSRNASLNGPGDPAKNQQVTRTKQTLAEAQQAVGIIKTGSGVDAI
jgi:hypothetical protein